MNRKIIATILALGMVAGAFAIMATPVKAASYYGFWLAEIDNGEARLRDSNDGANPNGGLYKWWKASEPQYYNQDYTTFGGSPMVGMSDWMGLNGQSATEYAAFSQTTGAAGPSDVNIGDLTYHVCELDANVAVEPRIYYSIVDGPNALGWTVNGVVPNGYLWAAPWNAATGGDDELFPSGFPATTFFELYKMPLPVEAAGSWSWSMPAHEADVPGNTASVIQTWHLMESVGDNNGPWTSVGSANYGTAISYAGVTGNWYSVRVVWQGGVNSAVLSAPVEMTGGPINTAPVVDSATTLPNPHNGNTVSEFVTLTATASDADSDPTTLQYSLDGGAWTTFTSPVQLNFPNGYTEGLHNVDVRAYDGTDYSAVVEADFTITDTTAPIATWGVVPGATAFWTNDLTFYAAYADFTAMNFALLNSYFSYSINAIAQPNIAWTNVSFAWGSYTNVLSATIPAGTGAAGDVITYNGQVRSTSATPQTTVLGAGGPITLQDPPVLTDPFPVFGAVVLYDGTQAGGYSPNAAPAGVPVTVGYYDFGLGAWNTIATVTDASGFYTVDIMNVVVGDPTGIEVAAGPFTGPGNMGYAWVPIVAAYAAGGVQVDVTCGVPAEVIITAPVDLSNVIAGTPFAATYRIVDIDGVLATGYYTFEGQMLWTSSDASFVAPAGRTFDGVATATPGTATDMLTLWTPPQQTIRIGENGLASNDMPSSLGNYGPVNIGGVSTPVFTDDWDQITLNIMGDSFDWDVVVGWNIVSVPMDPVFKGLNGVFDGADALAACNAVLADPALALASRSDLGVYTVIDLSTAEGAAFALDGVHGYWVYGEAAGWDVAGPTDLVNFLALNYAAVGFNTVNAVAGWNLLGFTHNFGTGTWNVAGNLDADYLTTALPGVAMTTKIVATQWDNAAQYYYSYVVTPTFVMPSRNWNWDFSYSAMPANGFYLWLDAPAAITFPMDY